MPCPSSKCQRCGDMHNSVGQFCPICVQELTVRLNRIETIRIAAEAQAKRLWLLEGEQLRKDRKK